MTPAYAYLRARSNGSVYEFAAVCASVGVDPAKGQVGERRCWRDGQNRAVQSELDGPR